MSDNIASVDGLKHKPVRKLVIRIMPFGSITKSRVCSSIRDQYTNQSLERNAAIFLESAWLGRKAALQTAL